MATRIRPIRSLCAILALATMLVAAVPFGIAAAQDRHGADYLDSLVAHRRYFELRDSIGARPGAAGDTQYFRGVLAGAFNDNAEALRALSAYVAGPRGAASPSRRETALRMLAASYRRVGAYRAAAGVYREIENRYAAGLDSAALAGFRHDERFTTALRDVPPQGTTWRPLTDTTVVAVAGYLMRVAIGGIPVDSMLAFDTGANYTLIDETTARTHHVRILDDTIDVETATGKTKPAHIGVLPSLTMGAVTVTNVVALVMADADLDIPEAHFHLTGLIGFPALLAAGDATLFPTGRIVLKRRNAWTVDWRAANLAFDGLQPLVEVTTGRRHLVMSLDTGAGATFLYPPFLRRAPALKVGTTTDSVTFGGVGNLSKQKSLVLHDVPLSAGGASVVMPKLTALQATTNSWSALIDGNLGRDVIKQLGVVTLDFASMNLSVHR